MKPASLGALAAVAALLLTPATAATNALAVAADPSQVGFFESPIGEPGPNCPADSATPFPMLSTPQNGTPCKPAAVNLMYLPNGKVLYWDGLEGMENVQANTVAEYGQVATCDQSRLLDLSGPSWSVPTPADAGCSTANYQSSYLVPGLPFDGVNADSDALFCSDQVFLYNGDVLTTGGTDYYNEPNVPGANVGVSELEGTRTSRVYDLLTNSWYRVGDMNYGRWYPSLVTLPSGNLFVASGVTKLLKPMYPDRPADSGTNVKETETFDILTGKWTWNGDNGALAAGAGPAFASSSYSLPLYPRLHLLPDGKVYYDAGGQTFNPDGQSYDEAAWNFPALYDPAARAWTTIHQLPGVGTATPGFRGSGFSVALPLAPPYTAASFLSGGGVTGVTPGSYIATDTSEVSTVDTSGGQDAWSNSPTGSLNNRRWYSTAIVLPDESVMAFSGADKDEVVAPGTGTPITQAERFTPGANGYSDGSWAPMASAHDGRTYHNTAILLPSGQVLVGGHSPINFLYSREETVPGLSNNFRDFTFEIYNPPYMYAARPDVTYVSSQVLTPGMVFTLTSHSAAAIQGSGKVLLVRNPAITHLVDGDQRTVELQVLSRSGDSLQVRVPSNPAVLPPGPYFLFADVKSGSSLIPSTGIQMFVEPTTAQPNPNSLPPTAQPLTVSRQQQAQAAAVTLQAERAAARVQRPADPGLPWQLLPIAGAAALWAGAAWAIRRRESRRA